MQNPADTADALDRLDHNARTMAVAALERGLPTEVAELSPGIGRATRPHLRIGGADRRFVVRGGVVRHERNGRPGQHINGAATAITVDKALTKAIARAAGLSVARGALFPAGEEGMAKAFFRALGHPVCVKPVNGRKGTLVTVGVRDPEAFARVFAITAAHGRVLVEESLAGEVIRHFYVAPRVVAVKLSRPPNVVGDGAATIARLIAVKNGERARRHLPSHRPISIDGSVRDHLAREGRSLDNVPRDGERVLLGLVSNASVGGDTIACAGTTHPSYGTIVEALCRSIPDLVIAAVDMMVEDRGQPAAPGNHWILEVNSSPGVTDYHHPWEGPPQDVGGAILDRLFRGP